MSARVRRGSGKAAKEYETRDVSPRLVLLGILGLFVGMGVSTLIIFGILWWMTPAARPFPSILGSQQAQSGPRLEVSPSADRQVLERQTRQRLQAYGWVGRDRQTAHIPIDRAMAILTARGWPDPEDQAEGRR